MNTMKLDKGKYEAAVLYFIKNCNSHLGKVKLNKLLYYLDFVSYRDRKKSVTGDTYIHDDYGPVPSNTEEILARLKEEGKIRIDFDPTYKANGKYSFVALSDPNENVLDVYEKKIIDEICSFFSTWSTDEIITQTHLEAPWFYSKPYDIVDYNYSTDIDFFQSATA